MTRLLRLYPAAWRDRYGDELTDLLAENPPSVGDMIDLVRGAWDAHRHTALVPAAAGLDGSSQVPLDRPVTRRRVPVGAFLGTLSAGLFLVTGAALQLRAVMPHIAVELPSMLLSFASIALGLTLFVTTGRAVIAKLAGVAFLLGLMFLFWRNAYIPSGVAILAGSVLLVLGSLIEGQPARVIGAGVAGLTLALATSYNAELAMMPLIIAGYGLVALGLARSQGGSWRPIMVGIGGTAVAVTVVWVAALAVTPLRLHDGYVARCGDLPAEGCLNRIDLVAGRFRQLRPSDIITSGEVTADGVAQICATTVYSGQNPFDDPAWVDRLQADTSLGIQLAYEMRSEDGTSSTCWRD